MFSWVGGSKVVNGASWLLCSLLYSELDYHAVKLHTGYESFPDSSDFALVHANSYITTFPHAQHHRGERDHCLTSLTTTQFKPQNSTLKVAATVCSNHVFKTCVGSTNALWVTSMCNCLANRCFVIASLSLYPLLLHSFVLLANAFHW